MAYSLHGSPELRLAKQLVNQVARSIYDPPFVIIFDTLQRKEVWKELDLASEVSLTPKELQKYLAQMHAHRMVRKHVNKEKAPPRPGGGGGGGGGNSFYGQPRSQTVERSYWCLDYRDFYNVTKYRISAMRRTIEEKIKQELGKKGYICPTCQKTYDPLFIATLYDPFSNSFNCEDCQTALEENDNADTIQGSEESMARFNASTAKIRATLRELDNMIVPTVNVIAWVARNVESSVGVDLEMLEKMEKERAKENGLKVEITDQAEQERRKRERERLAEEQRVQNALPVWYTHSTVTGKQTQLGLEDKRKQAIQEAKRRLAEEGENAVEADDDDLDAHYAELLPAEPIPAPVKLEVKEEPADAKQEPADGVNPNGKRSRSPNRDSADPEQSREEDVMVMVNGIPMPFSQVTEDHHDDMTPEEYETYSELLFARM